MTHHLTSSSTTRFAPSPTGFLHLGHVVSALHARTLAGNGGQFLIRIEDIDTTRCTVSLTDALREDLAWLGFRSARPIRQQSGHMAGYQRVLASLKERQLLYPCFCSRRDIGRAAHATAPDGSLIYPGTCRPNGGAPSMSCSAPERGSADARERPVWRLNMRRALDLLQEVPGWYERGRGRIAGRAEAFGDVVLARRDTGLSYHLCVGHDDALAGITLVTRGLDLYEATSVHRVLQELMGWPEPAYAHHQLIVDAEGNKLSKRDGAEGIRFLRAQGATARDVLEHPLVVSALERSLVGVA